MFANSIKKISLFALLFFAFTACEEIPPDIDPPSVNTTTPIDSTGETLRHVLIEEFTGVQCVNCPEGAQLIENLINTHGDRLIAVSLHAGFFAEPLSESQYDLSTDESEQLDALIGPAEGYPSAAINRNSFGTASNIQFSPTWAGHVADELAIPPKVGVSITNSFNNTTRNLDVEVTIDFLETIAGDLSLSVLITENDIIDAQIDQSGVVENYKHKHVFRTMLSNIAGDAIGGQAVGTSTTKNFNFTLAPEWDVDKCTVVAFVHQSGPELNVLQVAELSVKD